MLHNCSMHIKSYKNQWDKRDGYVDENGEPFLTHRCSVCKKDMSHKLQIRDYFNNLDKALCQ